MASSEELPEPQENAYKALATEAGIDRPVMNQKQFEEEYGGVRETKQVPIRRQMKRAAARCFHPCSSPRNILNTFLSFVPIIRWLPSYSFRQNIAADIVGGITTGIMHVPQGLAYSALAGVDPVYGLYSSCFPAFFYMLFGTSRHTSIGSFAVVTLMAGIANDNVMHITGGRIDSNSSEIAANLTSIQVASTLTFAVGLVQFVCGILRLEFLASYFSDPLVSGFTTGSAVHVFMAQVDDVFGLTNLPKSSGIGYIFVRAYNIFEAAVVRTNWAAVITSACAISFLYIGKEYVNPALKKRGLLKIPIPYELILIIITTIISYVFDLNERYSLPIVGYIPSGPPNPALPVFEILPDCLVQSLGMVVVTVAVHISMAKMIAKQKEYAIDARQELYALGASSMLGGMFSVYPVSTALGRTMVNVNAGTKTQLSTLFSCSLLLILILWLGPLLEPLPMCILASIIMMALKSMFERGDEIRTLWRVSRTDLIVWIVAFTSTVVIDVMEGLAISIAFALLTVIFRSQWPKWERVLGNMSSEPENSMPSEASIPRPAVCVFRFDAPLIFTNVERFTDKVKKTIDEWDLQMDSNSSTAVVEHSTPSRCFILDCSSIVYIDYMGVKAISETAMDLQKRDLTVYLAAVKPGVLQVLRAHGLLNKFSKEQIFPTLHDALAIADRNASAAEMLASAKLASPVRNDYGAISLTLPSTPTSSLPGASVLFPQ